LSELETGDGPKRILIVSDSLGTPIHPRGIFHYTTNLTKALNNCGHTLSLLIETTGVHGRHSFGASPVETIYRYLANKEFAGYYPVGPPSWEPHLRRLQVPTRGLPLLSPRGLALALHVSSAIRPAKVPGDPFFPTPEGLEHLSLIGEFLTSHAIYTLSRGASMLGFQAPTVDARGYDWVLVDTPSYFRFKTSPGARVAGVIHDLIPLADPTRPRWERRSFRHKLEATLEAMTDVVYVSEATKEHVRTAFPDVVRGKREAILHPSVPDGIAAGLRVPTATSDYFVAILSDEVRKNLDGLARSLAHWPPGIRLKVIGYFTPDRQALYTAMDPRVEFLGYVPDSVKQETLAGSIGLIMPSFLEGFGIPLIESAMHGKPVFCSDIPAFREVMGGNAFYFDPHTPDSVARAIRSYLDEPEAYIARIAEAQTRSRRRFGLQALTAAVEAHFGRVGSPSHVGAPK